MRFFKFVNNSYLNTDVGEVNISMPATDYNINVLPNYIAIVYKDAANKAYRFLTTKSTPVTFMSTTNLTIYYDGIYSHKFGIFYAKDVNHLVKLYDNVENTQPTFLNASSQEGFPMEFLFAAGETKFITFFQGANFIKIR